MAKQYDRALLEVEVKKRLESVRDELGLSSLSATVDFLIDNLTANERNPRSESATTN